MSPNEETWEETLLFPPPDVVSMWGLMEDSGDCCGFMARNVQNWRVARCRSLQTEVERQTKAADQETPKWRVARHGSLQLNKEKMQIKHTGLAARLTVYIHHREARTAERSGRSETAKQ